MELPESTSEGIGHKLFSVGSALISAVKKPFADDKDKKESMIIERAFADPKGYHCILSTDGGDNFYLNIKDNKIKYLQGLRGKIVKAAAFNEIGTEDDTNVYTFFLSSYIFFFFKGYSIGHQGFKNCSV